MIRVALAQLERETLPSYEPDDWPLTDAQKTEIGRIALGVTGPEQVF